MFGISDPGIWIVYLLSILCTVGSIIFGIIYWNKEDENDTKEE